MTMLSKPKEVLFATAMSAISFAFLLGTYRYPEDAVTFPRFLLILSCMFSVLLMVRAIGLRAQQQATPQSPWTRIGAPIKVFVSISIYIAAIEILGFYVASAMFLLGSMLMYGRDSWSTRLLVTGGFLLVIYVLFGWLIGVRLPAGLLF